MSLDITIIPVKELVCDCGKVHPIPGSSEYFSVNITHNLGEMAEAAGIYDALWRPYRLCEGYKDFGDDHEAEYEFEDSARPTAEMVIPLLEKGLADLRARPSHFKQFNSPNGWGLYEHFVPFVEEVLEACKNMPKGLVETSR
jgi:hypothetical protein